jgi:septum site-determining protein MinC
MPTKIVLKGIRQGILIHVEEGETWSDAKQALQEHFDQQAEFLRGARIALDLGSFVLKAVELGQLRDILLEREMYLWAVISTSPTTEQTAQTMGLDTQIESHRRAALDVETEAGIVGAEGAVLVFKTLRSGIKVQFLGHVTVIGDVNPGAEIIAGGNIVVWGRVGGLVHAGAGGDEMAVICALDLHPTQLRIADQIAITPQRKGKPQPETAKLKDGIVVAEVWNPKGK